MPSSDERAAGPEGDPEPGPVEEGWLTPGVAGVGAASFFSDAGHEVTTAVLPGFLTSTLHGSAAALGVIEGVSDALIGVMKLVGGPLADDPRARARLAGGGYLGTAVATGAIGLAATVWQAGLLRGLAWMSRGLRSPARDSLLASLVEPRAYGRAFGLERAGDNLGAVAGPLLAAALVAAVGIRPTLYLAAVPGVFAAVAITGAAREASGRRPAGARRRLRLELGALRRAGLARPLLPIAAFELGNVATTLLILRATQLLTGGGSDVGLGGGVGGGSDGGVSGGLGGGVGGGVGGLGAGLNGGAVSGADVGRSVAAATSLAILLYAAHNAVAALAAAGGGHWIDRAGPRAVFATGAALYTAAYAGFALPVHGPLLLLAFFALAGAGIGLAETAESALLARLLPDHLRGSGFGLLGGLQSVCDLLASAVVGLLYAALSPSIGFGYAAAWMALSVLASALLAQPPPNHARPAPAQRP